DTSKREPLSESANSHYVVTKTFCRLTHWVAALYNGSELMHYTFFLWDGHLARPLYFQANKSPHKIHPLIQQFRK
ncbi:MAG: hypothetical protein ACYT04_66950, partial [Nostoc sp.]